MWCCSIAAIVLTGSNPGSTTIDPPLTSTDVSTAAPEWLSGAQIRWRTCSGHSQLVSWIIAEVVAVRWVVMMPLGLPVVPPE